MPENDPDLLAIERGSVVAPAGCGKTELIARALGRHASAKPILVLTHTNAGVAALRGRLNRANVPASAYRLATLDAWAIRVIQAFPQRSGHDPQIVDGERPNYPAIRRAATGLLRAQHIDDIIAGSYGRLLVDEYQDCLTIQHVLVTEIARSIPTCVVGDPVQAIFGFANNRLIDWEADVAPAFPAMGELDQPWRWINAGSQLLGEWLLTVRRCLIDGNPIDLDDAPDAVTWVELRGDQHDHSKLLRACRTPAPDQQGTVLVIADSRNPQGQKQFASQTPGAVAIESVDLRDFVEFAQSLDLASDGALEDIVEFARSVMTGIGTADLLRRVDILRRGRGRRDASDIERAAMAFIAQRTFASIGALLSEMSAAGGVRTYRPTVLRVCLRALQKCTGDPALTFPEAAIYEREQYRFVGRQIPKRAVGSTLLLKGLESDVVVVHDADQLDARNLYVALTRGSKRVVICSRRRRWTPQW